MGKKDIKIGETYYVRVKVTAISENRFVCRPLLWNGTMSDFAPNYFNFAEAEAFYKSIPEQPKHEPCREFRKGDIVKYRMKDGRECPGMPLDKFYREKTLTVIENEDINHRVLVETQDGRNKYIAFFYLELVIPVEELEPYTISEGAGIIEVYNEKCEAVKAWFYNNVKAGVKALTEAEAERDRLNAEWRKEQEC